MTITTVAEHNTASHLFARMTFDEREAHKEVARHIAMIGKKAHKSHIESLPVHKLGCDKGVLNFLLERCKYVSRVDELGPIFYRIVVAGPKPVPSFLNWWCSTI